MSIEDQNAGEAIRREVMGTTHVDTPLGSAKNFFPCRFATVV